MTYKGMIVGLVAFADANTHTEVNHARKGLEERPSRVETRASGHSLM